MILRDRRAKGHLDLEAVENLIRPAMLRAGAATLGEFLRFDPPALEDRRRPCPCGHQASYKEPRERIIRTVLGPAKLERPYYLCPECHEGQFPADIQLDVAHTELSPAVRRLLAIAGSEVPFGRGSDLIAAFAGIKVTAKAVERTAESIGADIAALDQRAIEGASRLDLPAVAGDPIPVLYIEMDGTGVPVVKSETEGRKGKIQGQRALTREAKIGCVFTQTTHNKEGFAMRDPDSTTYAGAIETAAEFGHRIYLEAWNRGWSRARLKVFIADGAELNWNIAHQHFPGAIQILDIFHARQHLWDVARLLFPSDNSRQKRWILRHQPKLDGGKIIKLVAFLRSLQPASTATSELIAKEAAYFENNAHRMAYPSFRKLHLFIGSGVIEAACKTVIAKRLKDSGMYWTVRGANAIIALRCCDLNHRFEDYWATRNTA